MIIRNYIAGTELVIVIKGICECCSQEARDECHLAYNDIYNSETFPFPLSSIKEIIITKRQQHRSNINKVRNG